MPIAEYLCACPVDSRMQLIWKLAMNEARLYTLMSNGEWTGRVPSLIGPDGCGCSEVQMLAAAVQNSASFFNWYSANGGGGGGNSVELVTNNAGNTTITPTTARHTEVVTVGGAARTSVFIADVAGRSDGDLLTIRFDQPATPAIVEEVRDATAGGTLLYTYTTDGTGDDNMTVTLYFEGGAWHPLSNAVPVV